MRGILILITFCIIIGYAAFLLWRKRTKSIDEISAYVDSYWDAIKEKRKFVRFEKRLKVNCKVPEKIGTKYQIFSSDISGEGICLQVPEMLPAGSALELEIDIPGGRPLHVNGDVVWVKENRKEPSKPERTFSAGIKFRHVNDKDKARLIKFLLSSPDDR